MNEWLRNKVIAALLNAALMPLYKPRYPRYSESAFSQLYSHFVYIIIAFVSMESIHFYNPPFMKLVFGRKYTTSPHIDHKPPVALSHKKGSQAFKSTSAIAVDGGGDF